MSRDWWILILFSVLGPFAGVAWFTALAKFAALLSRSPSSSLGMAVAQIAGAIIGLGISAAAIVAASKEARLDE